MRIRLAILFALLACPADRCWSSYVQPMMGGAQVAEGTAPMKHADVSYDGSSLTVQVDASVPTPKLRPLVETDQFDPSGVWGMINDNAYNFQYGWNPGRFDAYPPSNAWVWIEQLDASPGLKVYQRPPASPTGQPIFGTDGGSTRWRWSGSMTHNLYAIEPPKTDTLFATYRVYIGYDATGDPVPGKGDALVTFQFLVDPFLPGDYDQDSDVDPDDYAVWRESYGAMGGDLPADGNQDGRVDAADYAVWRNALTSAPATVAATPEPAAIAMLAGALAMLSVRARTSPAD